MYTRHISAVFLNGQIVHAQYGQFDGYPSVTGVKIKHFLHANASNAENLLRFTANLGKLKTVDEALWTKLWCEHAGIALEDVPTAPAIEKAVVDAFFEKYPNLDYKMGADWFRYVANTPEPLLRASTPEFACDGLACEWAWVVNLDDATLEVYAGGRKAPGYYGVFEPYVASMPVHEMVDYFPCQRVAIFSFSDLRDMPDTEFDLACQRVRSAAGSRVLNGVELRAVPTGCDGIFRWAVVRDEQGARLYMEIGEPDAVDFNSVHVTPAAAVEWLQALTKALTPFLEN